MGVTTNRLPAIRVPDECDLGPAMLALTKPQQAFVTAVMLDGGKNYKAAALIAGYGGNPNAAHVSAHHLMRNPKVLAAIREEADRRLRSGVALASSTLVELCGDVSQSGSVRLKAAEALLDRGGLLLVKEHVVHHEDNRATKEVREMILSLAKANNLDIKKLGVDDPVDAEFTELSSEGLEDLLE
jgi:phage terminase small subunit